MHWTSRGALENNPRGRGAFRAFAHPTLATLARPEEVRCTVSKDEAEAGVAEMSEKFRQMGGEVYVDAEKVRESNKAL